MKSFWTYFRVSVWISVVGLLAGFGIGYYYGGTIALAVSSAWIVLVLGVLEVSISFDNAVVNASFLQEMTPKWQHRFLTWGMWIAVFGMRLVFPLLIVAVVAHLNPWEALRLAAFSPHEYAKIMVSAHHEVSAFGGSFLMLVAMKYFFDHQKTNHWIRLIERPLSKMGRLESAEVGFVLIILFVFSRFAHPDEALSVLYAGIAGVLIYLAVEGIGEFLKVPQGARDLHRASLGMFLYLEVLDASFSFDGVIGAFAITNNLFIIAIGLGIGAMFVRSLTILMVEKGTLETFEYLEHGAFYAVACLAGIMFFSLNIEVPEWITGLLGAAIIGFSILASVRKKRQQHR